MHRLITKILLPVVIKTIIRQISWPKGGVRTLNSPGTGLSTRLTVNLPDVAASVIREREREYLLYLLILYHVNTSDV